MRSTSSKIIAIVAVATFITALNACIVHIGGNDDEYDVQHWQPQQEDEYYSSDQGNIDNVNENIKLGKNANAGKLENVNGNIYLKGNNNVQQVETVNGDIDIDENVTVANAVTSVNGRIQLDSHSSVGGDIHSVNGNIKLKDATVMGSIKVVNSDISLKDHSEVHGDIVYGSDDSFFSDWNDNHNSPTLRIGKDVILHGNIILYRPVNVKFDGQPQPDKIKRPDSK
ncbi:DUF4097 family beta strand repeat-containing protein [Alteromonadaceae bacterium BrNp21-10]|nr:DUF4097 family beta strand repeat-containing protein [Alteromonadaceae bacterium BrNp21-10]